MWGLPSWCVTSLLYNRYAIASQLSSVITLSQFKLCRAQETGLQKQLFMTVTHRAGKSVLSHFYLRPKNAVMAQNLTNLPIISDTYFKTNDITIRKKPSHFSVSYLISHVAILFLLNNLREFYYLLIAEPVIFHVW